MKKKIYGLDFEIINYIPDDYWIWNVNFNQGFLPLCQMLDDVYINTKTVKAVPLDKESLEIIKKAQSTGYLNRKTRGNVKEKNTLSPQELEIISQASVILKSLKKYEDNKRVVFPELMNEKKTNK